jgi:hypothetical protein
MLNRSAGVKFNDTRYEFYRNAQKEAGFNNSASTRHMTAVNFYVRNLMPNAQVYFCTTGSETAGMVGCLAYAKELSVHVITCSVSMFIGEMTDPEWIAADAAYSAAIDTLYDSTGNGPLIFSSAGNGWKDRVISGTRRAWQSQDKIISVGALAGRSTIAFGDTEQPDASNVHKTGEYRDSPDLASASYSLTEEQYAALPYEYWHPYPWWPLGSTNWHASSWMSPCLATIVAAAMMQAPNQTITKDQLLKSGTYYPDKTVNYGYGHPILSTILDPSVEKPIYGVLKELRDLKAHLGIAL